MIARWFAQFWRSDYGAVAKALLVVWAGAVFVALTNYGNAPPPSERLLALVAFVALWRTFRTKEAPDA